MVQDLRYSSLQEIQAMFTLDDVKKTRLFQEIAAEVREKGKLEGKLEVVTRLLKMGLTVEKIAEVLDLDVEVVRKASSQGNDS
jgi:predicted transposase/invertase (TIGR01784 family)